MFPENPWAAPRGSFYRPVSVPAEDPDAGFKQTILVNCEWLPYIRGALMQLLLQSTWDTQNPDVLAHVQQQVFTLIDLFSECSGGSLPFSCPFDFTVFGADAAYFINQFEGSYTPNYIGQFVPGLGWQDTVAANSAPNYNRGVQIYRDLPSVVNVDAFQMTYNLVNGILDGGHTNQIIVYLYHLGSVVHTTVQTAYADGFTVLNDTFSAIDIDAIYLNMVCGFHYNSDPGGSLTVESFDYNVTSGGCA